MFKNFIFYAVSQLYRPNPCLNFLQLKALGMEGMIKELIQYLRDAEKPFSSIYSLLGTPIYNIVLHSLVQTKDVSTLNYLIFSSFMCCLNMFFSFSYQ